MHPYHRNSRKDEVGLFCWNNSPLSWEEVHRIFFHLPGLAGMSIDPSRVTLHQPSAHMTRSTQGPVHRTPLPCTFTQLSLCKGPVLFQHSFLMAQHHNPPELSSWADLKMVQKLPNVQKQHFSKSKYHFTCTKEFFRLLVRLKKRQFVT